MIALQVPGRRALLKRQHSLQQRTARSSRVRAHMSRVMSELLLLPFSLLPPHCRYVHVMSTSECCTCCNVLHIPLTPPPPPPSPHFSSPLRRVKPKPGPASLTNEARGCLKVYSVSQAMTKLGQIQSSLLVAGASGSETGGLALCRTAPAKV